MTKEKPLSEKRKTTIDKQNDFIDYYIEKDVAHAVERLKEEINNYHQLRTETVNKLIDEIFGDLK